MTQIHNKETREFQAETKQLLDLMIHSIYTNKEIFLRELISNASDAIDKVRFESLTNQDLLEGDSNFEIFILPDEASHTITISDNGIGMTYDEVVENIGTIAKSGTMKISKLLSPSSKSWLVKDSKRSLSMASEALEMSSRKKISLLV